MTAPRGIAIVGMACRFPGGVTDPESFWKLLSEGKDAVGEIPPDRMDVGHYYDERPATPGRIMTRWGGYLDGLDQLDADFFGISPREAERLDPQQRLMLETAWEAIEDAGVDAKTLETGATGVFVGQWLSDFESRLFADPEGVDFYMTVGSGRYATSGRLSYVFGWRGPSLTLDTACSSSLAAVHLAVRAIRGGECEIALAGGTNVILQPHITIAYSQSRMMAPDGRCKFGDARADGYVRSEGAALLVLKDAERALADGDRIYAVIRGSAINNDGRSSGSMGTPSRLGQEELVRAAYADAGVAPNRARYVEAHGTGTRAGDPVEIGALGKVLGEGRTEGRVLVGSVKTNIGHTEGAAGVAGLMKATLALYHREIPASLHCHEPSPNIPWSELSIEVAREKSQWPAGDGPRVASVSAFGIAGTNAHVVLEEAPARAEAPAGRASRPLNLLPLSAKSPEALRTLAGRYAELLEGPHAPSVGDLVFSAAKRRTALEVRAAFVGSDAAAMADALRRYAAGEPAAAEGRAEPGGRPRIVFVVPGQGAQWIGMARELMAKEPIFREAIERCDVSARRWLDKTSIAAQLAGDEEAPIAVIQPVLVAIAIAYAELWASLGVKPHAVIGHSMGEVGAAHIAGVLDLDRAMQIICRRSALMQRTSGRGAMALVDLSMADAKARLEAHGVTDRVGVAVSNSPRSSVISGEPAAVNDMLASFEREGVFCRLIKVDVASHSPQMEPLATELARELDGMTPAAAQIPLYSTVLARRAEGHELDASYWAKNLRQPVRFGDTVSEILASADGAEAIFVELGPHPVLLTAIEQTAQAADKPAVTVACSRRNEPEQASMLAAAGALWASGWPLAWERLLPARARHVALPLYAWQRERHWALAARTPRAGEAAAMARHATPDAESLEWLHRFVWSVAPPPPSSPEKASPGRWLVLGGDPALTAALVEAGQTVETAPLERLDAVVGGEAPSAIVVSADGDADPAYLPIRVVQAVLRAKWTTPPKLWFVTTGAEATGSGAEPRIAVDQAALWGTARVVAEEHPELWGGLVDGEAGAPVPLSAALLARHLLAGDGEDQAALRGGERLVLRLDRVSADAAARIATEAVTWRADAAYLITGGFGDVGLHVARAMAERGARRIVLLGRTALPPRAEWSKTPADTPAGERVAAVRQLEALGVSVHVASVDVADEGELAGFLATYAAEGWPPIRGVIHAAVALDRRLARDMTRAAFDVSLRAKLRGAQNLDRLLPELDAFIVFSSVGAFVPQPGVANYAAANVGLEALAHDRRARGQHALAIAWGVWANTGVLKDAKGDQHIAELARQGIGAFTPDQAMRLFAGLAAPDHDREGAVVAVLPVDWATFKSVRAGRDYALFRSLLASAGGGATLTAEPELAKRLANAPVAERRQMLDSVVRESVGKVLKIAPARLDPKKALGSMGLNSLLAMELRNRLETALGRALSATLAFNYPTVGALVDHLVGPEGSAPEAAPSQAPADTTSTGDHLKKIAELSDEEAALALRSRRRKP